MSAPSPTNSTHHYDRLARDSYSSKCPFPPWPTTTTDAYAICLFSSPSRKSSFAAAEHWDYPPNPIACVLIRCFESKDECFPGSLSNTHYCSVLTVRMTLNSKLHARPITFRPKSDEFALKKWSLHDVQLSKMLHVQSVIIDVFWIISVSPPLWTSLLLRAIHEVQLVFSLLLLWTLSTHVTVEEFW